MAVVRKRDPNRRYSAQAIPSAGCPHIPPPGGLAQRRLALLGPVDILSVFEVLYGRNRSLLPNGTVAGHVTGLRKPWPRFYVVRILLSGGDVLLLDLVNTRPGQNSTRLFRGPSSQSGCQVLAVAKRFQMPNFYRSVCPRRPAMIPSSGR